VRVRGGGFRIRGFGEEGLGLGVSGLASSARMKRMLRMAAFSRGHSPWLTQWGCFPRELSDLDQGLIMKRQVVSEGGWGPAEIEVSSMPVSMFGAVPRGPHVRYSMLLARVLHVMFDGGIGGQIQCLLYIRYHTRL
jgi:hypothetical protein